MPDTEAVCDYCAFSFGPKTGIKREGENWKLNKKKREDGNHECME